MLLFLFRAYRPPTSLLCSAFKVATEVEITWFTIKGIWLSGEFPDLTLFMDWVIEGLTVDLGFFPITTLKGNTESSFSGLVKTTFSLTCHY